MYCLRMIAPMVDLESATHAEAVESYAEDGIPEEAARVYLAVLRNPDPRLPID